MAFPLTPTDLPAWHMPDVASWLGFRAARTQQMRAVEFPRLTLVQVVQGSNGSAWVGTVRWPAPTPCCWPRRAAGWMWKTCPRPVASARNVWCWPRRWWRVLPAAMPPCWTDPRRCPPRACRCRQRCSRRGGTVWRAGASRLIHACSATGWKNCCWCWRWTAIAPPLRPPATLTVSEQVRRLLLNQPGAPWLADAVALRLHRSPATLRRQLAREGQAFNQLLRDCRLGQALMLLQTTAQPIAQIAGVCGYTCPSRFALAFRQRYGVSPSSLRATLPPARGDRHVKTLEA